MGCLAEARVYNPLEKKLDFRTVNSYFFGYPENSKGYRIYCPNYSTRIVETRNARFYDNCEISESIKQNDVVIQEIRVPLLLPFISKDIGNSSTNEHTEESTINDQLHDEVITNENVDDVPPKPALRRSQRQRRLTIFDDYLLYLIEFEGTKDPVFYLKAIKDLNSDK